MANTLETGDLLPVNRDNIGTATLLAEIGERVADTKEKAMAALRRAEEKLSDTEYADVVLTSVTERDSAYEVSYGDGWSSLIEKKYGMVPHA